MPTFDCLLRFIKDYENLTPEQRARFRRAVGRFIDDLTQHQGRFRKGLRIRPMKGFEGIHEMTWAPDGRATFQFGEPIHEGEPHIIWRRCGTHQIFKKP